MKIITVSHFSAHPPESGGKLRISNYNSALSCKENITVTQFSYTPFYFTKKNKYSFNNGHYVEHIFSSIFYCAAIFITWIICGIRPWWFITAFIFKAAIRPKKKMLREFKDADIIQIEQPYLYWWVKKYTSKPVVIIAHNVEYFLAKSIIEVNRKKLNFFHKKAIQLYFRMEKEALTGADKVMVVSEFDKKQIVDLYGVNEKNIHIVPNGINVQEYTPISKMIQEEARKKLGLEDYSTVILFTGSNYHPNIMAAEYIEQELAPHFDEKTLFLIAGSVRKKAYKSGNVFYTGRLEGNLFSECFKSADIAINPMSYGSGSNIKMFEYFASALPTITTENGAEGVNPEIKKDLIITDIKNFAQETAALIKNEERQKDLSLSLHKKARYHDYTYITDKALSYYKEAMEKK